MSLRITIFFFILLEVKEKKKVEREKKGREKRKREKRKREKSERKKNFGLFCLEKKLEVLLKYYEFK